MVYEKLKPLITDECEFVNLPETGRARWGETLDAEKMKKCVWLGNRKLILYMAQKMAGTRSSRATKSD